MFFLQVKTNTSFILLAVSRRYFFTYLFAICFGVDFVLPSQFMYIFIYFAKFMFSELDVRENNCSIDLALFSRV